MFSRVRREKISESKAINPCRPRNALNGAETVVNGKLWVLCDDKMIYSAKFMNLKTPLLLCFTFYPFEAVTCDRFSFKLLALFAIATDKSCHICL